MVTVEAMVRAAVAERGPRPFGEVMDLALYHSAGGFYSGSGRAGRRGDFLTSPEVGPLFGAVMASALDAWWRAAGEPDPWTVVEVGAGTGTWARSILAAGPQCGGVLRLVLVERSAAQRELHAGLVVAAGRGGGPSVQSREGLPEPAGPCLVLANELLDNLAVDLAERTGQGWAEVRVGVEGGDLVEVLVPTDPAPLDALAPDAAPGSRIPVQAAAAVWLGEALALAGRGGGVVVFDYGSSTPEMAARESRNWLRTYRGHERGGPPLEGLGTQDITCEVAVDQLAGVARPQRAVTQAEWLAAQGIGGLVEEGRRVWRERAHIGDLEAVRARSRVAEAEALVNPGGLGGFVVLEWWP